MAWEPTGEWEALKLNKVKIGLIFDGETEKLAFEKRICRKTCQPFMRKRNSNGKDVSLEVISNECVRLLSALNSRGAQSSFIVIDREKRRISASQMGIQLTELISSRSSENFIVVIADIMFENWLVADIEGIKLKYPDLIKDDALNSNYDGQHGVSVIVYSQLTGHRISH